ncbi:M23 family metallopeptidase [Gorillibacterium sp. sgz5001074]|uniref:M23 family metallopeptidase n=1 Tax=Gorillibacterium sp. sgz5001074 TaxID=3446695 RepID=UPI003F67537C
MDWLIAMMLVFQSLTSAADTQAKAEAELLRQAIALEASYYAEPAQAERLMEEPMVLLPSTVDQGDALLVRSRSGGEVAWQGRSYPLQEFGAGYFTLLPVPTDTKPGTYPLTDGHGSAVLTVKTKAFDTDRLTVTQEQESMWQNTDRINADQKKIDLARSKSEPRFLYREPFVKPVNGRLTTPYGYTRYVNGVFNSIHRAVDLAAPTGTPVKAANSGKVVLAEELYLTGNSIYIDHGMHLFSQYAHLSKLSVRTGDTVTAGQVIGEVGSTGFSTGPHLHFTFWIGNTATNPDRFFDKTPFRWQNK